MVDEKVTTDPVNNVITTVYYVMAMPFNMFAGKVN